jgi:hypothetical protein
VVDLADGEAVVLVVGHGQVGPATGEEHTSALRPDRLDGRPGHVVCIAHGNAAEPHVHRRVPLGDRPPGTRGDG